MIKFIVLFSLALAGHKARGLMLRGSGQILQRPNFINSESQLDAKKSFLQINKNNGKSLLKTNLYLQQDEDKQEQSYLQGREEEEIKSILKRTEREFNPHEIYEGLNLVDFGGDSRLDVLKRIVEKVVKGNSKEKESGVHFLGYLELIGGGNVRKSKDELKDLSTRILYLVDGREKSIKDQLARIGEEGNAKKIDKGLRRMLFVSGYEDLKYLTKLVDKLFSDNTSDETEARECIKKLSEFGSRKPLESEARALSRRIKSLVDPETRYLRNID